MRPLGEAGEELLVLEFCCGVAIFLLWGISHAARRAQVALESIAANQKALLTSAAGRIAPGPDAAGAVSDWGARVHGEVQSLRHEVAAVREELQELNRACNDLYHLDICIADGIEKYVSETAAKSAKLLSGAPGTVEERP